MTIRTRNRTSPWSVLLERTDEGFTMIEVIVAMVLAIASIGALSGLFINGNTSALASQRQSQLIAVADQQIEQLREQVKTNSLGFAGLAMSTSPAVDPAATLSATLASTPTSAPFPNAHLDPNYFVTATAGCGPSNAGYKIEKNYDDSSEGVLTTVPTFTLCGSGVEPLVIAGGGFVTAGPTSVAVGSGTASVYEYVTATNIGCSSGSADYVSGAGGPCYADARRVIVAVRMDTPGSRTDVGPATPVYVSTIITNPVPSNQANGSVGLTLGLNIG